MKRQSRILIAILACATSVVNSQKPEPDRTIYVVEGYGPSITSSLQPKDEFVIVRKTISPPLKHAGPPPTIESEVARLQSVANAIVVVEVQKAEARLTAKGDWIRTGVRATIKEVVRQAQFPLGDGMTASFDIDGGEIRIGNTVVKTDRYPILRPGSTYLLFFQHDPSGEYWYPFMPFLLDGTGRLTRAEEFDSFKDQFNSPIYGQPARDIIERFRRTQ